MEEVFSFLTPDILIGVALLIAALVFVYTIGRDYAVTMNLAVYLAIGTMLFVPWVRDFSLVDTPDHLVKIIIFAALVLVLGFLQTRNGFFEPIVVASGWESSVFAVTFTGMVATVLVSFLPVEMVVELSDYTKLLFMEGPFVNIWFLLPVAVLLFIRGDA